MQRAPKERRGMRAEAWEGLHFVWQDRRLRALTASTLIFNFCANGAFAAISSMRFGRSTSRRRRSA